VTVSAPIQPERWVGRQPALHEPRIAGHALRRGLSCLSPSSSMRIWSQ